MEMADLEVVLSKGARIHELKRKIAECKQGGLSIEAYYTKMNTFWQQLDAHIHQRVSNPSHETQKLREEDKVHQLLTGLDETLFGRVRSALLAMDPLPSLDRVRSILVQEEDRLNPLNLPVEIVEEILMRLPPKHLFVLKGVSSRCKAAVMDPSFARKYMSSSPHLRGMLYPRIESYRESRCIDTFLSPHVDRVHHQLLLFHTVNRGPCTRLLASSNGLVLSWLGPWGFALKVYYNRIQLYLSNPLINQSFKLPHINAHPHDHVHISRTKWTCGLALRGTETFGSSSSTPSNKIEYKVVFIQRPWTWDTKSEHVSIKIFSSDTASWIDVVSKIACPQVVSQNFLLGPDFCYKGILHWIDGSDTRTIVTYDPYDAPDRFGHISLPNASNDGSRANEFLSLFHSGHEDVVKCCEIEWSTSSSNDLSLLVWRLANYGKGEWCLEQRCRISPSCDGGSLKGCRQLIAPDPSNPEAGFCYIFARDNRVSAIDLGSGQEENVSIPKDFHEVIPEPVDRHQLVPFVQCPWSSPYPIPEHMPA